MREQRQLTRASNGAARSWSFVRTPTAGPVVIRSAPSKLAAAQAAGLTQIMSKGAVDASGFAKYRIDLNL